MRYAPGAMRQATRLLELLRPLVVLLGHFTRSSAAWPMRRLLRRLLGRDRYERLRVGLWVRTKEVAKVDPLHGDILPLIEQLDRQGLLRNGAATKLRSVARRIRAGDSRGSAWQSEVKPGCGDSSRGRPLDRGAVDRVRG